MASWPGGRRRRSGTPTSMTKQPPGSRWAAALAKHATCCSCVVRFPMVLNTRYTSRKRPSTRVVAMSPIVTCDALRVVLGSELLGHGGGELDPGHGYAARGERQRDPSGADGELERRAVAGQLGQQVDRRTEHVGVEHRAGGLVVAGGDVFAEVILEHADTLAPRRATGAAELLAAVRVGAAFEDHGLGLEERQQTFLAALATDPRLLEPAERHAEVGAERVVADGAGPELAGDGAGPVDVVGEHRRVQAVDRVVRDPDRVLLVGRRDDGEDRTEDLLLADRRSVVDVAEDRRLDEVAAVEILRAAATGRERRALVDALGDVAEHPVALAVRHERPELRLLVERVADARLREASPRVRRPARRGGSASR